MEEEVNPKSKLPYGVSAVSLGMVDGPSLENVKQKSKRVKWTGDDAEIIRLPVTLIIKHDLLTPTVIYSTMHIY